MDIFKIFTSLYEVIIEFAASLVLIPKTLAKVIISPRWTLRYIDSEIARDSRINFNGYSHPVLFWLVVGVLPYYFLLQFLILQLGNNKVIAVYDSIGVELKITAFIIFFISLPVSCALVIQLLKHRNFEKTIFRRLLFIQCYITAPLQLFYLPAFFLDEVSETWSGVFAIVSLAVVVWFAVSEVILTKIEIGLGWFKAVGTLILFYCSYFIFVAITLLLFFLFNMGTFKKLFDAWIDG